MFKEKLKKFFSKKDQRKKTRGQSLVEIALTFPVLLLLLSGMVEFGFMLNYYLSLTDATRETARFFSNFDPFLRDANGEIAGDDINGFYAPAASFLRDNLEPDDTEPDTSRKISLDPDEDDIIITVFSVHSGTFSRHPTSTGGEYSELGNKTSRFDNAEITSRLVNTAPDTGVILVEIFYDYHQLLKLPWLAFIPDPVHMHGYTMMPLSAAEPTSTP